MGWIRPEDKMPPSGLLVLLEVSGYWTSNLIADHSFELGCWIGNPDGNREPFWVIHGATEYCGKYYELDNPTVHAWMPLPKHYEPNEMFDQEEDLMEHPMFEDDPEWLYKGDCVYEQMTLEDFMEMGASADECIDYAEQQSKWMDKYAMIDIYKDKSENYRQIAKWLRELKAYKEAREEIGCLPIVWEEGAGIRKCIDILDKHLMEVTADGTEKNS